MYNLLSELQVEEGVQINQSSKIYKHNGVISVYLQFTLTQSFTKQDVLFTFSNKLRGQLSYLEAPCFIHAPDTFIGFLRFQFTANNVQPNDQTMSTGEYRMSCTYLASND